MRYLLVMCGIFFILAGCREERQLEIFNCNRCGEWEQCQPKQNRCVLKRDFCNTAADCTGNLVCEAHQCVISDPVDLCSDTVCSELERCNPENGGCILKAGYCHTVDDCSGDLLCEDNRCVTRECFSRSDCDDGQYCDIDRGKCLDFEVKKDQVIAPGMDHVCFLNDRSGVSCFGENQSAAGREKDEASDLIKEIVTETALLSNMIAVISGGGYSCGLNDSDQLYCWGDLTPLGIDQTTNRAIALSIPEGLVIEQIGSGDQFLCITGIFEARRSIFCRGDNSSGALSDEKIDTVSEFTEVIFTDQQGEILQIREIITGGESLCIIDQGGALDCRGNIQNGFAGVTVNSEFQVLYGVAGSGHGCFLNDDQQLYCFGNNTLGQLGFNGGNLPNPSLQNGVTGLPEGFVVQQLSSGSNHTCVTDGKSVYCWGDNSYYAINQGVKKLSENAITEAITLELPGEYDSIEAIGLGFNSSCILLNQDTEQSLYCRGEQFDPAGALIVLSE